MPDTSLRLHVVDDLAGDRRVALEDGQAHYLATVMRRRVGDTVLLFNGRDGEWRARIEAIGRRGCVLAVEARTRPQADGPDVWLVFAPVKHGRIDDLVGHATELGVAAFWPVKTERTNVAGVNAKRLRANAIEAAEQSERLTVPALLDYVPLHAALARWPEARRMLMCDESGAAPPLAPALANAPRSPREPWAILVGPEGGFARSELDDLRKLPFVTAVSLGPRVLRAETAALAALACWQVLIGDWQEAHRHGS